MKNSRCFRGTKSQVRRNSSNEKCAENSREWKKNGNFMMPRLREEKT